MWTGHGYVLLICYFFLKKISLVFVVVLLLLHFSNLCSLILVGPLPVVFSSPLSFFVALLLFLFTSPSSSSSSSSSPSLKTLTSFQFLSFHIDLTHSSLCFSTGRKKKNQSVVRLKSVKASVPSEIEDGNSTYKLFTLNVRERPCNIY